MAVEHELQALEAERRGRSAKLLDFQRKAELRSAYRRCFTDENGDLSADGALVLGDLARTAKLGIVTIDAPDSFLQFREGQRSIVLHAFGKMDPAKLASLIQSIREITQ